MPITLITGLAGTGKSAVITELARQGHNAVDTSTEEWSEWRRVRETGSSEQGPRDEWVWRESRIADLLALASGDHLFIAGCCSNMTALASKFDQIVLLTADRQRMLDRLAPRWDLRFAGDRFERYLVLRDLDVTLPKLRDFAHHEIDTTNQGIAEVARMIVTIRGSESPSTTG
jgi:broad-specificity NMP kinase